MFFSSALGRAGVSSLCECLTSKHECVCVCVLGEGIKPEDVVTEQTILNSVLFKLFFILVFC